MSGLLEFTHPALRASTLSKKEGFGCGGRWKEERAVGLGMILYPGRCHWAELIMAFSQRCHSLKMSLVMSTPKILWHNAKMTMPECPDFWKLESGNCYRAIVSRDSEPEICYRAIVSRD
jgi:hypothetical protein